MYLKDDFKQEMLYQINESKLLKRKKYVYSDLGFLVFPDLLSEIFAVNYEQLHQNRFILPIGANTVCYNPYRFYPTEQFVPTEIDNQFRKERLQGFVQDETAALLGGVSGNAGLFGTTNDLAKIMQFYLNKGSYGDFSLFEPETFDLFNTVQYKDNDNRRALGFDKPYINNAEKELKDAYPAPEVSPQSFGHTGFSGTFAWCDPRNGMTILIMTNRTFPSRENTRIVKYNFRPSLQQAIYKTQKTFSPEY
jgi:CubicO group peptidase (beta-lactamase class C family)